ncbi:MAG: TPM domain-containing protein [Eggerthellaceae bacterium]|nr:TPM domain-containing protein [Eggerthellaceae bacterium]
MKLKIKGIFLSLIVAIAMIVPSVAYADESWMQNDPQLPHVVDAVGILSESEVAALEQQAQAIEDQYDFGVYMVVVEDYTLFSPTSVFDAATTIYKDYSLGVGPGKDGLMLLLSMWDRDYSLITYGDRGNYAFNDEGRNYMTDYFLDDFAYDEWYVGFADFLEVSAMYLDAAEAGTPYFAEGGSDGSGGTNVPVTTDEALGTIGIYLLAVLLIPLIISFLIIKSMDAKMRSVAAAVHASQYVTNPLELTEQSDSFSHVTRIVTAIPKNDSHDFGGGPSISHGGGFSGSSGKF